MLLSFGLVHHVHSVPVKFLKNRVTHSKPAGSICVWQGSGRAWGQQGMASPSTGSLLRNLGRLFNSGTTLGLDDSDLLARFVMYRDESAFEAIVQRHGPMVLSVCRRLLADVPHTVDDAFQATFLVLVKRASSIRNPARLGPWLYGVAHRVALKARSIALRQRSREQGGEALRLHEPADLVNAEPRLGPELHEELRRLPRAYRDVLVICDLESRSHEEAARLLGWPVGTVKGRHFRAREQLRKRLNRRGLALLPPALVATLSVDARAAVPSRLVDLTLQNVLAFATGKTIAGAAAASTAAVTLAQGVHHSMTTSLISTIALTLAAAGTLGTTAVVATRQGAQGPPASAVTANTAPQASGNTIASDKPESAQKAAVDLDEPLSGKEAGTDPEIAAKKELIARLREELRRTQFDNRVMQAIGNLLGNPDLFEDQVAMIRNTSVANMLQDILQVGSEAATKAHLARLTGFTEKLTKIVTENPQEAGAARIRSVMNSSRAREDGADKVDPKDSSVGVNLQLVLAEADLWVAEAHANQPLTGLDSGAGVLDRVDARPTPNQSFDPTTQAILKALDQPISLNLADGLPLREAMAVIQSTLKDSALPEGRLPVYFDREAQAQLDSIVSIELTGVPLKTQLHLLLKQAELAYVVKDGLIMIDTKDNFRNLFSDPSAIEGEPPIPGYGATPKVGFSAPGGA